MCTVNAGAAASQLNLHGSPPPCQAYRPRRRLLVPCYLWWSHTTSTLTPYVNILPTRRRGASNSPTLCRRWVVRGVRDARGVVRVPAAVKVAARQHSHASQVDRVCDEMRRDTTTRRLAEEAPSVTLRLAAVASALRPLARPRNSLAVAPRYVRLRRGDLPAGLADLTETL